MVKEPRGRGITENDVWQAADALLLEGARPTIERVRTHLGRGSPNTVSPYLDTWFRSLGARIKDPMAFSAPPEVPEPVRQAAHHFWEAALAGARAETASAMAADRAAIEDAQSRLAADREQLREETERLAAQARAREDAMELARNHLAETANRIAALEVQISERDQSVRQLKVDLAAALTACDAFRCSLDTERVNHDAERKAIEERAAAHDRRYAIEVDRAREATKAAEAKLARLERESAAHAARCTKELATALQENEDRKTSLAAAGAELGRLRLAAESATRDLLDERQAFAAREDVLRSQMTEMQTQVSAMLGQLAAKDTEIAALVRSMAAEMAAGRRPSKQRSAKSTSTGGNKTA